MMKTRILLILIALSVFNAQAHDPTVSNAGPVLNKDGSVVTGILTAQYDPIAGNLPFPINLVIGADDLTLDIPFDPADPSAGLFEALNSQDGFSTTEKWTTAFIDQNGSPGQIDPSSVIPGLSVRVFQVTTAQVVAVTGIIRELVAGVDFHAVASGNIVAILPLKPLPESSNFMVVMTNDIRDVNGNDATSDFFYHISKAHSPWVDAQGRSTYPLLSDAQAQGAEQLRQITNTMEFAAAAAGINHEDIILSWTVKTQSITPTLKLLRSIAQPSPVDTIPIQQTTAAVGGLGLADIVIGQISLPYYLGIPSAQNPLAPLTDFWTAPPGGYIPPCQPFGLDPTSTNITACNPFPVPTGVVTVPVLITVPNANSGFTKPEGGWPVVIYVHGVTRNRTDMLAVADAMASAGMVGIAIDQPLHGVVPEVAPQLTPFFIGNSPFAASAKERTFGLDYFNNTTGALAPDGIPDSSGSSTFNLLSLRTARDNLRQATADQSILAVSLPGISVDGDNEPDLNPFDVSLVMHSLGVTVGMGFAAIEPLVSRTYVNEGTGALIRTALGGSFGNQLRGALASVGILSGTSEFELFVTVAQTLVDSADGINWAAEAAARIPLIHNTVIGSRTVPNGVPGEPLAGSEALTRAMGLDQYSTTQVNPEGFRGFARFLPPAFHESFFRPVSDDPPFEEAAATTIEMQGQMASFLASGGTVVQVNNPDVMEQVVNISEVGDLTADDPNSANNKKRSKKSATRLDQAGAGKRRAPGRREQ